VISFDAEGTLVTHRFSEYIWEEAIPCMYARKEGVSTDEAKAYVRAEFSTIGEDRTEWYDITFWFDRFGLCDHEELLNAHRGKMAHYQEVEEVLRGLGKNHRLIVSSNSSREFLELEMDGIDGHFEKVFSAPSDFNRIKKNGVFYQEVCDILGIEPDEMIHVGDRWADDFLAPRRIGIFSFHLDRKGEDENYESGKGEFTVRTLREFRTRVERSEEDPSGELPTDASSD